MSEQAIRRDPPRRRWLRRLLVLPVLMVVSYIVPSIPTIIPEVFGLNPLVEAVLVTAAMDDTGKSAWCREHGVYPQELEQWRQAATQALAEPEDARASHRETKADRRRIEELERELRRKDKALAETAALLVLSKKLEVIFHKDRDEDA